MKKSKNIIAIVLVAIIGTVIFWKRDLIKEKFEKVTNPKSKNSPEQNVLPSPQAAPGITYTNSDKFPLKLGSSGPKVKGLQQALNRNFNAGLQIDGNFGLQTEKALEKAGFGKEVEMSEITKIL